MGDTGSGRTVREAAPVLIAVDDPGLVDEAAVVVAATGRRLVSRQEVAAGAAGTAGTGGTGGLVVVTDSPASSDSAWGPRARIVRVTGNLLQEGHEGVEDVEGGVLQLPEDATALAAEIGCHDLVDVAVAGVAGGAGTSVFAAALAGHVASTDADGPGQALLVDQDPHSRSGHLHLVLGLEGGVAEEVTWIGDVGVTEDGDHTTARPARPVVRDLGRTDLGTAGDQATALVLVVPQTVPAVLAARHAVEAAPGVHVVLRELPRSGLTWNQTISLLGRAPSVTWEDDPFLTVDVDRGDFRTTGHGAGTAATAAARLWGQIR